MPITAELCIGNINLSIYNDVSYFMCTGPSCRTGYLSSARAACLQLGYNSVKRESILLICINNKSIRSPVPTELILRNTHSMCGTTYFPMID